jgi:hypothetical protein
MDDENSDKQLPIPIEQEHEYNDGFDEPDDRGGYGPIEKFVDGDWTVGGVPSDPKRRLVAVRAEVFIRRWKDKRVAEIFTTKPLPDLDELNATVPQNEWELDLNGNPRPPYERAHRLDLLNLDTAEHTCFISATTGAAIAVSRLKDKVAWMRRMRGANVVPQIELSWTTFPTRFGTRKRPDFKILAWLDLTTGSPVLPQAAAPKQLPPVAPKQVTEPSTAQDLDDEIPSKGGKGLSDRPGSLAA